MNDERVKNLEQGIGQNTHKVGKKYSYILLYRTMTSKLQEHRMKIKLITRISFEFREVLRYTMKVLLGEHLRNSYNYQIFSQKGQHIIDIYLF